MSETGKTTDKKGAVQQILLPPNIQVWNTVRQIVPDNQVRVNKLASAICEDPVLVIEFLRASSSMHFSQGRAAVTTIKASIERLGVDATIDTLEKIKKHPAFEDEKLEEYFERCRDASKRVGKIATFFGEILAQNLVDDCEVAGTLMRTGEMLAVAHFGPEYVKLADGLARTKILYRLEKDHKYDVESKGLDYLQRAGVPDAILFALDRKAKVKTPSRGIIKPICMAANEIVSIYDGGRWERIAPGKNLPPTSPVRMLALNDRQYERFYEKASEFLNQSDEEEETV